MRVRTTGCHHMAFVTNNMDETVKFYNGLLGFPVVVTLQLPNPDPFPGAVPGNLGGSRHYFFRIGERDTIAFFEFKDAEVPVDNSLLGAGNHLAITVPSTAELRKAKELLEDNGVEVKFDLDHGFCRSIHFDDPINQIALGFATWQHPCDEEEPFLQDPNPVPAALAAIGRERYGRYQLHYDPDGRGGEGPRD
ncbi:VOC family protein [Saccharopolyspora sp. K220]|uniref:VOC family protein n=1 Tax=Saccharopolyspora soli TaxID=2926618 RepID=UPI001F57BB19|nr:VOC family protein [Saccharopolyspora soli]MCI2422112.1 VOC family protein [Saccharopolyspora soli]